MPEGLRSRVFERLPKIGFGGAPLGNLFEIVTESQAYQALDAAWNNGCRYFDTAPLYGYGLSESRIGGFLQEKDPSEFVIATKVGRLLVRGKENDPAQKFQAIPDFSAKYDYSYDGVMRSVEASKARLGLDRINVLNVHDVDSYTHGERRSVFYGQLMDETNGGYRALDELRRTGEIDAFGLGVNETEVCEMFMRDADPDDFLVAGLYTLLNQAALSSFLPNCLEKGISVIAGGVFQSGILATGSSGNGTYNYESPEPEIVDKVKLIEEVCETFSIPLPSAAIQFTLRHPAIKVAILGMRSNEEVESNYSHASVEIPQEFWSILGERDLI